ncbi:hypothetical protein ACSSV1_001166 [Labrenzia sp. MBR-25]|jgi:hypothetical protein
MSGNESAVDALAGTGIRLEHQMYCACAEAATEPGAGARFSTVQGSNFASVHPAAQGG